MPAPTREQLIALLDRVSSRNGFHQPPVTGVRREHMLWGFNGKTQDFPKATFEVVKVHRGRKHLGFVVRIEGERKPVYVAARQFTGKASALYAFDDGDGWATA